MRSSTQLAREFASVDNIAGYTRLMRELGERRTEIESRLRAITPSRSPSLHPHPIAWQKASIEEEKALMKQRVEAWDDAHQAYFETMRNMTEFESALQMSIAKTGSVLTDELDTFADFGIAKIGDALGTANTQFKEMSVYADQAARNMQSAFADFLFDPFEGGVKGMLKSFIDAIRRMMAEKAAAAIFDSVSNGGLGLGGLIGSLFGFAKGGSFEVGGSGGTDSQLVAFRATPGEKVDVTPPRGGLGGSAGGAITINQHFDNRGATVEAIQLLPAVAKQASDDAVSRILKMRRQGRL